MSSRAQGSAWIAFKLLVLSLGGAVAFWPDDLRPVAWQVLVRLATHGPGPTLLGALAALGACLVGITVLGHVLLPDEPTPRPDDPNER